MLWPGYKLEVLIIIYLPYIRLKIKPVLELDL